MYRQGLGDCFLLTFDVGRSERHMLIDCGTLGSTTTGVSTGDAVADIRATTNGHLDLLVATHEHWDHVKAFKTEADEFKAFRNGIDHAWLAWTENPADDDAKAIKKYTNDLGAALCAALRAAPAAAAARVPDTLSFFGDSARLGASSFSASVHEAMEAVRTGLGAEVKYREPGESPIEPSFIPGFRFYVLGPPRSSAALREMGEHGSPELYGFSGVRAAASRAVRPAGVEPSLEDWTAEEREMPFDSRVRAASGDMRERWYPSYKDASHGWRRIDDEWTSVIPDLALQLDNLTNNTSLALAIERVVDGRVLLFPGDAQQGNWTSWHNPAMRWTVKDSSGTTRTVTAADLLARTVFYKVGHHASHNATASGKGLELMSREDELVAFIPVDRAVALKKSPAGSWKMPAFKLYRRLLERCRGRVVRADIGWAADAATARNKEAEKAFIGIAGASEWAAWKQEQAAASASGRITIDPSKPYIDYLLD